MKIRTILSVTMLALLTACGPAEDSNGPAEEAGPEASQTEAPQSETAEAAEVLDSTIPHAQKSEVMDLQQRALSLPMPSLDSASGYAKRYDAIHGAHMSARDVDLCELAYLFDGGAGRYRVVDIVSVAETMEIGGRQRPAAFTYIQLELLQDWSGFAPDRPVVRIRGGALDNQRAQTWDISARVGEEIGLFLSSPLKGLNQGYYRTNSLGVFRQKDDGGFSNGQLFHDEVTSIDELGRLSAELYQSLPQVVHRPPWRRLAIPRDRCAHDIAPDAHQHDIDLDALRKQQPVPEEVQLDRTPE